MRSALVDCGRCFVPAGNNVLSVATNEGNIDRNLQVPANLRFYDFAVDAVDTLGVLRYSTSLGSIVTLILGLPRSSKAFKAA